MVKSVFFSDFSWSGDDSDKFDNVETIKNPAK